MAAYTYLPWVRQGLIGAAAAGTVVDGRLQLPVSVTVSGGVGATSRPIGVQLFGPGDVTGFDPRQVIRTDPPNLAPDFEANYFALVEFDRPDFPWVATPTVPNASQQLTPWICLVVIERRDDVELTSDGTRPLPMLSIASGAFDELPDLTEAWAWAHAQVGAVTGTADLASALQSQPERTLSRLICPRRLKPRTAYLACVVPTFKGGVRAGLGEAVAAAEALDLAWTRSATTPAAIRLPVYFSWEFSTGAKGDFEALVWELERRQLTFEQVGTRKVDAGQAGYGLPATAPIDLEGALQPDASGFTRVGPSTMYQHRLQALVNQTAVPPLPVLPPPIYGRWQALQRAIPDSMTPGRTRDRQWLRTLNLDPAYRAAAGLGAQVVRDQQEQLMASAWDQVGDIVLANQLILQAQLSRAGSREIHAQRLGGLGDTAFLLATAPLLSRVRYTAARTGTTRTARGHIKDSGLPVAVTSSQFRRALRPRGPIARRFGVAASSTRDALILRLNAGQLAAAPARWPVPAGMATIDSVVDRSPCRTDRRAIVDRLLEQWPPERLVELLAKLRDIFKDGAAEIDELDPATRSLLKRAAKNARVALDQLIALVRRLGGGGAGDKDKVVALVLSLFQPAMASIADARWLVARAARPLGAAPPQVIEELTKVADALPTLDELTTINFALAALAHLGDVEPCEDGPVSRRPPLDLAELKAQVQAATDPARTIPARLASFVEAPGWVANELNVVLAAPEFPAPMYKALARVSQDWLLPGLENVPPNTLALLATNPRFIEAFMVGLNHEMSRELLWRGYPTDQRGTYFRQFWDPSGRFAPTTDAALRADNEEAGKDIPPINEWGDGPLGSHLGQPRKSSVGAVTAMPAHVVVLVRGELLRRYPRAEIYLAQAAWSVDGGAKAPTRNPTAVEKHPIFRGELAPDVQLLGFDIDPVVAQGTDQPTTGADEGAGWFVMIQQQPTEPRYGLDDTASTSDPSQWTWRDLSWVHTARTGEFGYITLAPGLDAAFPTAAQHSVDGNWRWTPSTNPAEAQPDSAQIAAITLQGPVRVAVHASDLL